MKLKAKYRIKKKKIDGAQLLLSREQPKCCGCDAKQGESGLKSRLSLGSAGCGLIRGVFRLRGQSLSGALGGFFQLRIVKAGSRFMDALLGSPIVILAAGHHSLSWPLPGFFSLRIGKTGSRFVDALRAGGKSNAAYRE